MFALTGGEKTPRSMITSRQVLWQAECVILRADGARGRLTEQITLAGIISDEGGRG